MTTRTALAGGAVRGAVRRVAPRGEGARAGRASGGAGGRQREPGRRRRGPPAAPSGTGEEGAYIPRLLAHGQRPPPPGGGGLCGLLALGRASAGARTSQPHLPPPRPRGCRPALRSRPPAPAGLGTLTRFFSVWRSERKKTKQVMVKRVDTSH